MQIPGYEIQRTIGRGGMGTVYLAVQESLGRSVVLKTMSSDTGSLSRFLNEGRIVASLRHPHIITVYDIGTADGMLYMCMEYVDGGDLKAKMGETLNPDYALDILQKVTGALEFAHAKGIIHRDVKPANILFRSDGTPLLSDFGIAKELAGDTELTSTGMILGSPFYMSPEQAEGMEMDGRTDVYSLGIIFYEMLVGRRPFQGDSQIKVIMQHLQAPVPRFPDHLQRFQPLLDRMLAKDRQDRFKDATTLVGHIERLRHPPPALGAGAVPSPRTEPPAVATDRDVETAPPPGLARHPRSGRRRVWLGVGTLGLLAFGLSGLYLYSQWASASRSTVLPMRPPPAAAVMVEPAVVTVPQPTEGSPEGTTDPGNEPRGDPSPIATGEPASPGDSASATPDGSSQKNPTGSVDPVREDVVKAMIWLAEHSIRQDRLTSPPADNALYYLTRLRSMDPKNPGIAEGIAAMGERYVTLAEKQFAARNYQRSEQYIEQGLAVQPDNEALISLRALILSRNKSTLEIVLDFFRG